MTCDRVALTCEAVQYNGIAEPISLFTGRPVHPYYGRHVLISEDKTCWVFLNRGDWVIRGIGPGWDYYVVPDVKFRKLWKPRMH